MKVRRKAFSRVIAHVFWSKTLNLKHTWHLTSYTSEVFYVVFTKVYLLNVLQYQSMSSSNSFQTCELGTHCKQSFYKRTVQIQKKEGISSQVSLGDRLHLVLTSLERAADKKHGNHFYYLKLFSFKSICKNRPNYNKLRFA